jgi:H+/Cl- antiporter ClcA
VRGYAKICAIAIPVGVLAGLSSAAFLWLLDIATDTRFDNPWLLWLLPLGGLGVGLINRRSDPITNTGTSAVLAQAQASTTALPRSLAPTVLATTLVTHLFGGSAGREGTAVQMSAGLTDQFIAGPLNLDPRQRSALLRVAIAGGFGAVFGVPLAGAVFGLEVVRAKKNPLSTGSRHASAYLALPALIASIVGDQVVLALKIPHIDFPTLAAVNWSVSLSTQLVIAGLIFGLAATSFSGLARMMSGLFRILIPWTVMRPVVGGLILLVMMAISGTRDYLGLSLTLITDAVSVGVGVAGLAFVGKMIFTAVTLGSGFRGGEVTPLLVIGATLGASVGELLGAPVATFAALGMLAVFAGAARTPAACVVMGIELFGWSVALPATLVCIIAHQVVRNHGIYVEKH